MEQEIKIRRVDFYPTDWLEGTIDLTHTERSVYVTICAAIYAHGGPVEVAHVRRFCPGRGFQKGLQGLLRRGKVIREGEFLIQTRALKEVGRAQDRVVQAQANGVIGGRPGAESEPKVTPASHVKRHSSDTAVTLRCTVRDPVLNDINGVEKPAGFLARGRAIAHQSYNQREESFLGDSDSEEGRSAPLEEDATPPRRNGKSPALKAAIRDQLMQKHSRFLAARGGSGEVEAYWCAIAGDDLAAGKTMFEATDARMRGEGWDDTRNGEDRERAA